MIKLSLEIPKPHLEELSALTDLDFALAHEVLTDATYAKFYREQSERGRTVILDNGFHEMGESLSPQNLIKAATLINPTVIVAPDRLGDPEFTWKSFWTLQTIANGYAIAPVLCGRTPEQRDREWKKASNYTSWLFLPFKEPRIRWYEQLQTVPPENVHLLGMSSIQEIRDWALTAAEDAPDVQYSIDTSKPIKMAALGRPLSGIMRGTGPLDLEAECVSTTLQLAKDNIAELRRHLV